MLAFKKMMYDILREISNPVPPAFQGRRCGEIYGVTLHNV